MTTPTNIPIVDHRDDLVAATLRQLERQLPAVPIAYIWPKQHRVLIRTADGRIGDIEVMVNWDVTTTESPAAGSNAR